MATRSRDRTESAARLFSRNWEDLLEDAGLVSAAERSEAERDARALAEESWLELKSVRYRPHLIERLSIPLAAETRWREAFHFLPLSDEEARLIQEFSWQPELAFLPQARLSLAFAELRRLNDFFVNGGRDRPWVPLYERSLPIFGDEKRLDQIYRNSARFAEGRLTLDQLRCFTAAEPLGWKRGPVDSGPFIVLENAATWDSYSRWNARARLFSAVIYGGGNRFVDSVSFLKEIFQEVGGPRLVLYFGDLDMAGLEIPQRASRKAIRLGLPPIQPHLDSYRWLMRLGQGQAHATEARVKANRELCDWLGDLADVAWAYLSVGQRIAQEQVGTEFLLTCGP